MTNIVACHIRNAGVWKRTFPFVNVSGTWFPCQRVHAKVSGVWEVVWADVERALGTLSLDPLATSFDLFAPFSTSAGYRFDASGTSSKFEEPAQAPFSWINANNDWLKYDTGFHEYQVKFIDRSAETLDLNPTIGSFIDIGVSTLTFASQRTTEGSEQGVFDMIIIDKNAPGPAPTLVAAVITVTVTAGQI